MRCRFCNAPTTSDVGACRVCGARLRAAAQDIPVAPLPTSRPLQPLAPVRVKAEVETPQLLAQISREPDAPPIIASGFLNDSNGVATPVLVFEGEVQIWNIERGLFPVRATRRFAKRTATPATCVAFFSSDLIIATGHESGQIQLHHLQSLAAGDVPKSQTSLFSAHRGRVLSLGFSANRLWSAGSDGTVVSLDFLSPNTARREHIVMDGVAWLRCLAVSPNGARLALGGENGELQMWRVSPEGTLGPREWAIGWGDSALKSLTFSFNGQMLLGTDAAGTTRLWAAQTGHELQLFVGQKNVMPVLAPDNRLLAVPGLTGEIHLLDAWTGTTRDVIPLSFERVQCLAFASSCEDGGRHTRLLIAGASEIVLWKIGLQ